MGKGILSLYNFDFSEIFKSSEHPLTIWINYFNVAGR